MDFELPRQENILNYNYCRLYQELLMYTFCRSIHMHPHTRICLQTCSQEHMYVIEVVSTPQHQGVGDFSSNTPCGNLN